MSGGVALSAAWSGLTACSSPLSAARRALAPIPARASARAALAVAIARSDACLGAGKPIDAAAWLVAGGEHLASSHTWRVWLDAAGWASADSAGASPVAAATAAWRRATAAGRAGRLDVAVSEGEASAAHWPPLAPVGLRVAAHAALAAPETSRLRRESERLLGALRRACSRSGPGLGPSVWAFATVSMAGAALDRGDLKTAIARFLEVDAGTGWWREAKLGLAWAQLEAGRPDRALAVLRAIPGQLTGDPERAVLAAMAADASGHGAAAVAIVDEATTRATDQWLGAAARGDATVEAVLALVREPGRGAPVPEGRGEGLVRALACDDAVRPWALELAETRAETEARAETASRSALRAYEARVATELGRRLTDSTARHVMRCEQALDNLKALRPQLGSAGRKPAP